MATVKKESVKKDTLHKDLRMINIIDSSGAEYQVLSTFPSDTMKLEIDPYTHPAWNKGAGLVLNKKGSAFAKFQESYGDLF